MDTARAKTYVPLGLAVLLAAVLQAILIARMPTISADGIVFTSIARDLEAEPIAAFHKHDQHPGYPAAMLAATRIVQRLGYRAQPGSWMLGGRAISYVCGLLSVVVVWFFARDLYDEKVANIAAFVFTVLPLPRHLAADAQSDMPHALLYLTAAWLATRAIANGRLLPLAAAGVASAIAYWIRPEGLEVFVVAMAFVVWRGLHRDWPWRRVGLATATLATATLLVAAPYPILSGKITSKQLPFFKDNPAPTFVEQVAAAKPQQQTADVPTAVTPLADQPHEPPATATASAAPTPPAVVPSHAPVAVIPKPAPAPPVEPPAEPQHRYTAALMVRLGAKGAASLVECFCQGFKYIFMPLYFLGQWEMFRRRTPRPIIAFLWALASLHMVILLWVFYISGYIASRHVLPLIGLAMPFAALGILYAGEKLGQLLNVRPSRAAFATLAVSSLVVLPYSVRAYNHEFLPVIAATRWVQSHAAPNSGVVCNSPYVGYYGTLPTTILGFDGVSLDEVLDRGKAGVNYDFVILHVNAHGYLPEWVSQIERHYQQVREYQDPARSERPRKVLVFETLDAQARRRAGDSRS